MSANRRDLWWGLDMQGKGAARHQWNESLLSHLLAPAYVELVAHLCQTHSKQIKDNLKEYYSLFPKRVNSPPFETLRKCFYNALLQVETLYSPINGLCVCFCISAILCLLCVFF